MDELPVRGLGPTPRPPRSRGEAEEAPPLSLDTDTKNSVSEHAHAPEYEALHCEKPLGWLEVYCKHHSTRCWVPRRCRHCNACRQLQTAEVRLRAQTGIADYLHEHPGQYVAMLTLTSTPDMTWTEMTEGWSTFLRWLSRRRSVLWLRVAEEGHLHGAKHFHVLLVGWTPIPQAELSDAWLRATGKAYVVDIRAVSPDKGARYATKYVTKALAARDDGGELARPVQFSRGWPTAAAVRGERECAWTVLAEIQSPGTPPGSLDAVSRGGVFVVRAGRPGCVSGRTLNLQDHLYLYRLAYDVQRPPP